MLPIVFNLSKRGHHVWEQGKADHRNRVLVLSRWSSQEVTQQCPYSLKARSWSLASEPSLLLYQKARSASSSLRACKR